MNSRSKITRSLFCLFLLVVVLLVFVETKKVKKIHLTNAKFAKMVARHYKKGELEVEELEIGTDESVFQHSKLKGLKGLEELKGLKRLTIQGFTKGIDFGIIRKLPKLKELTLHECEIEKIKKDDLPIQLVKLDLSGNPRITQFRFLKSLKELRDLSLGKMELDEIPRLQNKELQRLYLWFNNIKDVRNIDQLKKLEVLELSFNTGLDKESMTHALRKMKKLKYLGVNFIGSVTQLDFLYQLPSHRVATLVDDHEMLVMDLIQESFIYRNNLEYERDNSFVMNGKSYLVVDIRWCHLDKLMVELMKKFGYDDGMEVDKRHMITFFSETIGRKLLNLPPAEEGASGSEL